MGMMINRRRTCGGKSLPYDAEIEYLEANGTQYIRTDYFPNHNSMIEAKGRYTHTGIVDNRNYMHYLLGVRDTTTYGYQVFADILFNYWGINHTDNGMIFGKPKSEYFTADLRFQDVEFAISKNGGYINGVRRFSGNDGLEFQCNYPLFLLWCNRDGTGQADKPPYGRIYYCKIYENNILVRDFIPVRIGQIGYMYDKVSGQLFGNQGTGAFILGPDV